MSWWEKLCSNADAFFTGRDDDYQLYKDAKSALLKAKTVAETEAAIKTIKTNTEAQEKRFYGDSYKEKSYDSMTEKEQATFRRAYDMAIQQKTIDDAYEEAEEKPESKPKSNHDLLNDLIKEYESQDPNSPTAITKEQYDDAKEVQKYYEKIDLSWMGDDDADIKVYKGNKQLMDQANTKLELLKSKEKTEKNLEDINAELGTRS